MHMLIRNFLCQMQCNPPPADTTAQLLLREQQQEEFIHSKMGKKNNFTNQIFGFSLQQAPSLIQKDAALRSELISLLKNSKTGA